MYIREISGQEFEMKKDDYQIIDVRTDFEFSLGHVEGARNIPYDEILSHIDEIDRDADTILYCRTNRRSEHAAMSLMAAGFDNVAIAPGVEIYDYHLVQ